MKSLVSTRIFLLFSAILMVGCSTAPQQQEEPSITAEEQQANLISAAVEEAAACYIELPAMDEASFAEYDSFRAWRKARQPGSPEYNGFLVWLEYQEYLRLSSQAN